MQSYTEIPSAQSLQSSLALLLNNDKTALSCSSGSAFPNANLQVGMLCFRTDQLKLYILKDATPTWMLLLDLNTTGGNAAAVSEAAYSLFLRNNGGANEGGELRFQKPASGSTLVGDLTVDFYQNQLRIYDGAGTNKGFYIDLTTGAAGIATKIWHDANDGAGSGLDADLLDGMQTSTSGDRWGVIPVVDATGTMEVGKTIDFHETDADTGDYTNRLTSAGTGVLQLNGVALPVSNGIAQTNLNADLLDGYHASSFVRTIQGVAPDVDGNVVVDLASKVSKAGDTMSGNLTVTNGAGAIVIDKVGDLTCYRTGGTTGYNFFNAAKTRSVGFNGTNYVMAGAELVVNGSTVFRAVGGALSQSGPTVSLNALHSGQVFAISTSGTFNGTPPRPASISFDAYGRYSGFTNCNCTCTCCFTAGTKVTMADGSVKAVEEVQPGEVVRGLFGQENIVLDQIVCHIEPGHNTYVINGEVRMTGEHLLWTGARWAAVDLTFYSKWYADRKARGETVGIDPIKVKQLEVGDRVFNDGALVTVESLEVQVAESDEDLFSFELTGDKTFVANGYGVESKTFTEGFAHV